MECMRVCTCLCLYACVCVWICARCQRGDGGACHHHQSSSHFTPHTPEFRLPLSFPLLLHFPLHPPLPPILPPPSHPRSCDRRHSKKNTDPRCLVSTVGDPAVWEHRHQRGCFELNFNATEPICRTASATPTAASLDRRRMGLTLFAVAIL